MEVLQFNARPAAVCCCLLVIFMQCKFITFSQNHFVKTNISCTVRTSWIRVKVPEAQRAGNCPLCSIEKGFRCGEHLRFDWGLEEQLPAKWNTALENQSLINKPTVTERH